MPEEPLRRTARFLTPHEAMNARDLTQDNIAFRTGEEDKHLKYIRKWIITLKTQLRRQRSLINDDQHIRVDRVGLVIPGSHTPLVYETVLEINNKWQMTRLRT